MARRSGTVWSQRTPAMQHPLESEVFRTLEHIGQAAAAVSHASSGLFELSTSLLSRGAAPSPRDDGRGLAWRERDERPPSLKRRWKAAPENHNEHLQNDLRRAMRDGHLEQVRWLSRRLDTTSTAPEHSGGYESGDGESDASHFSVGEDGRGLFDRLREARRCRSSRHGQSSDDEPVWPHSGSTPLPIGVRNANDTRHRVEWDGSLRLASGGYGSRVGGCESGGGWPTREVHSDERAGEMRVGGHIDEWSRRSWPRNPAQDRARQEDIHRSPPATANALPFASLQPDGDEGGLWNGVEGRNGGRHVLERDRASSAGSVRGRKEHTQLAGGNGGGLERAVAEALGGGVRGSGWVGGNHTWGSAGGGRDEAFVGSGWVGGDSAGLCG